MANNAEATSLLMDSVMAYYHDPAMIGRAALRTLTQVSAGEKVISDPTSPVVFCLEAACVMTSAAMTQNAVNTRKQYPYAATTQEDLYLHMSDKDYVGRFALPSATKITLMLNEGEVLRRMVVEPLTGIKKLIIPRNTEFIAGTTIFSIQYPIEIRQMLYSGLQVVWDTKVPSPLLELPSNLIDWEIRVPATENDVPEGRFITMTIDVLQFTIQTEYENINTTGASGNMTLTDLFYHARAYVQQSNNTWTEIRTTHTDQIYDSAVPTLALKVIDNVVYYSLPQIYITAGLTASKLRVDIYQTRGALEFDLAGYEASAFSANWKAIDPVDRSVYSAPLDQLSSLEERIIFSEAIVTGGRSNLGFDELRTRVIKNAIGSPTIPITNVQIEYALKDSGYEVVKNIDNVTRREFLATRAMPQPDDVSLITAATAGVLTLMTSLAEAVTNPFVIDNRTSITLTPEVVYRIVNDSLKMVTPAELQELQGLQTESRAIALSEGQYMRAPYYYVMDTADNNFAVRPYDLDSPKVISKTVVDENDTTQLQVTANVVEITKTPTGYTLVIITRSSKVYRELDSENLFVQLGFFPENELARAYILGELTGVNAEGERRYEFKLTSNLALTASHRLPILSQLYTSDDRFITAALEELFDIIFITNTPPPIGWSSRSIDAAIGAFQVPIGSYAINQERIRVKFGDALTALWTRARSVPKELDFQFYEEDIPLLYDKDIYADNGDGSTLNIVNGEVTYTKLHSRGDPVIRDGVPVMKFKAGEVIANTAYSPLVVQTDEGNIMARGVTRHVDLTVVDGLYWWANNNAAVTYRNKLVKFMTGWLVNDLALLSARLLELTEIYFHPKSSIGSVKVMVNNGTTTVIEAGQSFFVRLHVPATTYANPALQRELIRNTVTVISKSLLAAQVSLSNITRLLQESYGSDVIDVSLLPTGSMAPYHAVTVLDDANRLTIRKRLTNMTNDVLVVEEDVTVEFIRHYL